MHRFALIPGSWSIIKLPPDSPVPEWALASKEFFTVSRTPDELSVLCPTTLIPAGTDTGPRWSLFKIVGPFSFAAVGVLASFGTPLAAAGISIIAVSTHDTDYILVRSPDEATARQTLIVAGHMFVPHN